MTMGISALVGAVMRHPIGSIRPLGTFLRIARWQAASRIRPRLTVDWVNGRKMVVRRGDAGATGNIYFGLHEVEDMAFFAHFLREGDVFVDAGANVGSYTVLASASQAAIHAFEPAPETLPRLRANIEANAANAVVHEVALGRESGQARFTFGRDCVNSLDDSGETEVQLRTLDSFDLSPTAIKMDLEGGEEGAILGALRTLQSDTLLALEIETVSEATERVLQTAGFVRRWYDPFTRSLLASPFGTPNNQLWVRRESEVLARLQSGPDIYLRGRRLLA